MIHNYNDLTCFPTSITNTNTTNPSISESKPINHAATMDGKDTPTAFYKQQQKELTLDDVHGIQNNTMMYLESYQMKKTSW